MKNGREENTSTWMTITNGMLREKLMKKKEMNQTGFIGDDLVPILRRE